MLNVRLPEAPQRQVLYFGTSVPLAKFAFFQSVFLFFLLYFEEHPKDTTPSTHENCSNISKKVGKAEIQISTFVCLRCVTLFYTKNKMEQKIHY